MQSLFELCLLRKICKKYKYIYIKNWTRMELIMKSVPIYAKALVMVIVPITGISSSRGLTMARSICYLLKLLFSWGWPIDHFFEFQSVLIQITIQLRRTNWPLFSPFNPSILFVPIPIIFSPNPWLGTWPGMRSHQSTTCMAQLDRVSPYLISTKAFCDLSAGF